MTRPVLHIVGTPSGAWRSLAADLATQALGGPAGDDHGWRLDDEDQALLHRLDSDLVGQPCLVVVEHPVDALAARMGAAADVDVAAFLERWCTGARRLLGVAHDTARARLLVTRQDLARHPAAVAEAVARLVGRDCPTVAAPTAPPQPDMVAIAVARALVADHREALALHAELHAGCPPLADDDAADDGFVGPLEPASTLARLRQLRADAAALGAIRADEESRRRKETLLLSQLDGLEAEVDASHARIRELQASLVAQRDAASGVVVGGVRIGTRRDEAPHREIAFVFDGVSIGERQLPTVSVRLVEHHGHAGLVVFNESGRPPALRNWRESGTEGPLAYMLFIPSDRNTHANFDALGATDWMLLQGLVALVEQTARSRTGELGARWALVAARLRRGIQQLPSRFRHDGVKALPEGDGPRVLELRFEQASQGDRRAELLRARWHVAARLVELVRPARDADLPLLGWPLDAAGAPAESVSIGFDGPHGNESWRAMSIDDRRYVLALLAAMPAAVRLAASQSALPGVESLAGRAMHLLQSAQRSARGPSAARIARALLRRARPRDLMEAGT